MIEASRYSIQVRKVDIEGESYYHAKVKEFPYLNEYAESFSEAYDLIIDAIETSFSVLKMEGKDIPCPVDESVFEEYSGRVTLRLPKTLHASLSRQAELEDVSLNQLLVTALSDFNGFNSAHYMRRVEVYAKTTTSHVSPRLHSVSASRKPEVVTNTERGWSGWALQA